MIIKHQLIIKSKNLQHDNTITPWYRGVSWKMLCPKAMVAIFTSTRWLVRVLIRFQRSCQSSSAWGHRMKVWLRSSLPAQYGHVGGIFIPHLLRFLCVGSIWWVSNHNNSLSRLLDLLCQMLRLVITVTHLVSIAFETVQRSGMPRSP
jgi:hypothetical protein